MSTSGQNPVTVSLCEAPHASLLEQQWRQLESQANPSFFTTWSWVGCWLQGLEPHRHIRLLRATRGGETVGLGLLVGHDGKRMKLLPSRGLYLHATGDQSHDELAVEHNGLLVHREAAAEIAEAMYAHLLGLRGQWDRLVIPGLSGHLGLDALLKKHHSVLREDARPSYCVDLKAVRERGSDYLGMLSGSTRSQIKRSLKAYAELGPVTLTEAQDLDTALRYIERLKVLHQRQWESRGKPGAFANPVFGAFHNRQIADGLVRGHVQLLRVQAGQHDIGYLYNFVHRGQVLFYQSGFDYELIEKHGRPGLVAHALAIQHNAALGHTNYDFLAGDTRYKQSLSTGEQPMTWVTVHRDTWAFRLEEGLRRVKRLIDSRRAPAPEAGDDKRDAPPLRPYPLVAASMLALVQAFVPSSSGENLKPAQTIENAGDALEPLQPRRPSLSLN